MIWDGGCVTGVTKFGLTRAEVADRAGIKEAVVAYIEEQPMSVGTEVMLRLAYALDLPDTWLLGSDADVPPGFPARHPTIDVLREPECWRLVDDHGVGRIAFLAEQDDAPVVHPLNYTVRDHGLVMRARQGSLLEAAAGRSPGCPASFEVDHIDEAQGEGWSVLLRGQVMLTDAADEPAGVEPWAGWVRVRQVYLSPRIVTGRRIFVQRQRAVDAGGMHAAGWHIRRARGVADRSEHTLVRYPGGPGGQHEVIR